MPTLDDLPTLATVVLTGDDLIPVYDPRDAGSSKVKKAPLNAIMGLGSADITSAAAGSITISTRVLVITSGTTSTLTPPAATGALREILIVNDGSGTATLPTLGAGTEAVLTATSARLLSNGTSWYRVG